MLWRKLIACISYYCRWLAVVIKTDKCALFYISVYRRPLHYNARSGFNTIPLNTYSKMPSADNITPHTVLNKHCMRSDNEVHGSRMLHARATCEQNFTHQCSNRPLSVHNETRDRKAPAHRQLTGVWLWKDRGSLAWRNI